jgi:phosphatidylglycerophosphate synthase
MFESESIEPSILQGGLGVKAQFGVFALVLTCVVLVVSGLMYGISGAALLAVGLFSLIAVLAGFGLRHHPYDKLGAANLITTLRGGIVAFLAGLIIQPDLLQSYGWLVFGIAVVGFAMDGLDGYIARRDRMTTPFGARFDMEIDALSGAVLSLILWQSGTTGPEILILGFMRYIFVLAGFALPWLNRPLPKSFRRKAICVVQIASLIFLLCPAAPAVLFSPVAIAASAALIWSFAADTFWLKRAAN